MIQPADSEGADPNAREAEGASPLDDAAWRGSVDGCETPVDRGADPSLCGEKHKSPYQVALENGYSEVATEIKNHGGSRSCDR